MPTQFLDRAGLTYYTRSLEAKLGVPDGFFDGEATTSAEGAEIELEDVVGLESVQIMGDTEQAGTPTPDSPVAVETVTGRQVVTVLENQPYRSQEYEINLGKNLCDAGTVGFTQLEWIDLPEALPAGTYTFSAQVTSTDTDGTTCRVRFMPSRNADSVGDVFIGRADERTSVTITTTGTATGVYVYAGSNAASSTGDAATFTDIQIERGASATDYAEYFEPIELCKLRNYQDRIYKENGSWWLYRAVRHLSLAVADMNNGENYAGWKYVPYIEGDLGSGRNGEIDSMTQLKTNFISAQGSVRANTNDSGIAQVFLPAYAYPYLTQTEWQTQYPDLIAEIYYGILTPNTTQITNTALIEQLEALRKATMYDGTTYLTSSGEDLAAELGAVAWRKNLNGIVGAVRTMRE